MAPPNWVLSPRAFPISSADPATSAPSGQPRPFERQIVTVSNCPAISAAGTPLATEALSKRQPSRGAQGLDFVGRPPASAGGVVCVLDRNDARRRDVRPVGATSHPPDDVRPKAAGL